MSQLMVIVPAGRQARSFKQALLCSSIDLIMFPEKASSTQADETELSAYDTEGKRILMRQGWKLTLGGEARRPEDRSRVPR